MVRDTFLQKADLLEIEKYQEPKDMLAMARTHVPFSGSLQKHPHDQQKVILIPDPYSTQMIYFEFRQEDIHYLEKLHGIISLRGETIKITRIWVKKQSLAVRCAPFLVTSTEQLS